MKNLLILSAIGLVLSLNFAAAEATPQSVGDGCVGDKCSPSVVLPEGGALPEGVATNFVFIAPIIAGALAAGALAGGSGRGSSSTPSTTN